MEELVQGTAKGQQRPEEAERRTRDTAGEQAAKRIKLQIANRPVHAASSSSASPSDAIAGVMLQVPAMLLQAVSLKMLATRLQGGEGGGEGGAQDAAQDTVMSGADGRRNSFREKEEDEERAKRQRTGNETALEMEVSNVAKINDSRRFLDLRRDGWELENVNHLDAAMPVSSSRGAPSGLNWINTGSMPCTRDARAGMLARIRRQHRRRSTDAEHPEQHRV